MRRSPNNTTSNHSLASSDIHYNYNFGITKLVTYNYLVNLAKI